MKRDVLYIAIIILLVVFIFGQDISNRFTLPRTNTTLITQVKIDTVHGDSFPVLVYNSVPQPSDTVFITSTILTPIDTAALLHDYLLTRTYIDTIRNDSSYLIVINDTINRNRLRGRQVFFQNLRPTAINTFTTINKPLPKHRFYAGAYVGITQARRPVLAPSLVWISKKNRMLSISYDIVNSQTFVGIHYKINK